VIDFDKPSARVYLGSYNFSSPADIENGENLLLIRDRRIAVSCTIEALRLFDHYHFRVIQEEAKKAKKKLTLAKPPRNAGKCPGGPRTLRIHGKFSIANSSRRSWRKTGYASFDNIHAGMGLSPRSHKRPG
jgi:hypothetical protein